MRGLAITRNTLTIVTIVTVALGLSSCAKRGSTGSDQADADARHDRVLAEAATLQNPEDPKASDTTPIPLPAEPFPFQGPPLKRRTALRPTIEFPVEAVPAPAATIDSSDSSGTNAVGELATSAPSAADGLLEGELASAQAPSLAPAASGVRRIRRRDEWTEAEAAAEALGRIGKAATSEAVAMLDNPDPVVRRRGAEILARIGPDAVEAIDPLIRLLETDSAPEVRKAAAFALGQMGPNASEAIPALTRVLREAEN